MDIKKFIQELGDLNMDEIRNISPELLEALRRIIGDVQQINLVLNKKVRI